MAAKAIPQAARTWPSKIEAEFCAAEMMCAGERAPRRRARAAGPPPSAGRPRAPSRFFLAPRPALSDLRPEPVPLNIYFSMNMQI